MQKIYSIFWPSFLIAGFAEAAFFTIFDPQELYLFGEAVHYSAVATYSIGFFCFWSICALSSTVTSLLLRSAAEVNQGVGADKGTRSEAGR
jgi:hypothetical protein